LIKGLKDPSYNNLMKNAIDFSDAIILGSQEIPTEISDHLSASKKPILDYQTRETFFETYTEFYKNEVLNQ
jgi:starch synthase